MIYNLVVFSFIISFYLQVHTKIFSNILHIGYFVLRTTVRANKESVPHRLGRYFITRGWFSVN